MREHKLTCVLFAFNVSNIMDYRLVIAPTDTAEQLVEYLANIPEGTTHLDLSKNDLNRFSAAELIPFFSQLPASISSLNLAHNDFGPFKSSDELAELFAAIPSNIRSINLSYNLLGKKTPKELRAIFAKLPKDLIDLNLAHNESKHGRFSFFKYVPQHVELYSIIQLSTQLLRQVNEMSDQQFVEKVHNRITPKFKLNETRLRLLLNVLNQHKTPLAYLTLGLLYAGRIKHGKAVTEDDVVLAIDCFVKARKEIRFASRSNFILWELVALYVPQKISERIKTLEIYPPLTVLSSYEHYKNLPAEQLKLS